MPKESVTLSQYVFNDLASYKSSHIEITEKYFDMIEDDINRFIEERFLTLFINNLHNLLMLISKHICPYKQISMQRYKFII